MLELSNIHKSYTPDVPVLVDIDLHVAAGEIVCLLGPSGCGKTTLLRIVAGLEDADSGRVIFDGRDLASVPVHRRQFGLMFQEFALFPHMSVGQNVGFGLRMAGWPVPRIQQRVDEMLALVSLQGYAERSIFDLSGGERQRVALARSLAPNPRLLMLDEPLGSLDRTLREGLMSEVRAILKEVGVTALYVTHDQEEAFAVADRLVVMHRGRIEQIGTPQDVYANPANPFVAGFLGFTNLLPARVEPRARTRVHTPLGELTLLTANKPGTHTLLIRPTAVQAMQRVTAAQTRAQPNAGLTIHGTLAACSFRGSFYQVRVCVEDASDNLPDGVGGEAVTERVELRFQVPAGGKGNGGEMDPAAWQRGDRLAITLDPAGLSLLPAAVE
jgi:ABC-type Fe3+/spermidine/putrescine transport system ATPase subunit